MNAQNIENLILQNKNYNSAVANLDTEGKKELTDYLNGLVPEFGLKRMRMKDVYEMVRETIEIETQMEQ